MKILSVDVMLDPVTGGGGVERTFQMSRYLARSGHECTLLTTNLRLTSERVKALVGVKVLALPCLFARFYVPKFSYSAIKDVVADSDMIHLMQHWTVLNALVYFFARRLNKPYVICPAGSLPLYGRSRLLKKIYNLIIGNRIMLNASGHIAISPDEIDHFGEYGIRPEDVTLIPNGINVEDLDFQGENDFKEKHGIGTGRFILFMGRLNSIKGPDLLLEAFVKVHGKIPDYHLVFGGPDEGLLSELQETIARHDLAGRVHFLGYLAGPDKARAYDAAEFLAIPSRQEAMSIVVLEAGAAGTPVLITDQCGMNIVEDIEAGRVVRPTVAGLEAGIISMVSDAGKLSRMGGNLNKYTLDNFQWDAIVKKFISLYESILTKRNIV